MFMVGAGLQLNGPTMAFVLHYNEAAFVYLIYQLFCSGRTRGIKNAFPVQQIYQNKKVNCYSATHFNNVSLYTKSF